MAVGFSGIALAAFININANKLEEHEIEVLQQFASKIGKYCNVCGKLEGAKRCSGCKLIYFCGKPCQKKDWKIHKTFCKLITSGNYCSEVKTVFDLKETLRARECYYETADATIQPPIIPPYHDEYRKCFPTDVTNYDKLCRIWIEMQAICRYAEGIFRRKVGHYFIDRWDMCLKSKEHSLQLPMLEPGDILTDLVSSKVEEIGEPWRGNQSMKNTPVRPQTFQIGQTYVAIGFVDLSPLILGSFEPGKTSTEGAQPMKYVCYDNSPIVVARNKVLYKMMLDDVCMKSILQAWFSTGWSKKTLDDFQQSCTRVKADLDPTVHGNTDLKELLSHWINTTVEMESVQGLWSEKVDHLELITLANLRYEHDRVDYAKYVLTGHIFGREECDYMYGNLTMFALPDSCKEYIREKESLFFTIAIDFFGYTTTLLESVTLKIKSGLRRLIEHIQNQSVMCTFATENLSMSSMQVLTDISKMNATAIDWSNIQEYLNLDNFFKMAEACDGTNTAHSLHFMRWTSYVCGTQLIDYPNPLYMARDIAQERAKQYDIIKNKRPYLRKDEYIEQYLNSAIANLCPKYQQRFIDFAFGQRNIDINEVCSEVFNPFIRSENTFFITFNFKK